MVFRTEININCVGNYACGHIYYNQPETHEVKMAQHKIEDICLARAAELFGESEPVGARLKSELRYLDATESAFHYLVLKELAELSKEEKAWMLCLGSGAPFIEYLLGASPINPLPPHYRCGVCRHVEYSTEAKDGYDLPQKMCPVCGNSLLRDGHNCSAEMHQYNNRGRRAWPYFGVQISSSVLKRLQRRLDGRLVDAESKHHIFRDIELCTTERAEKLRMLSETTGIDTSAIVMDEDAVWRQVAQAQYEDCRLDMMHPEDRDEAKRKMSNKMVGAEGEAACSVHDITRIYGYRCGSFSIYHDLEELQSPVFYATKDDIFDVLIQNGFSADRGAIMAHRIGWGNKVYLKKVPSTILGNMNSIDNLWTQHSCMAHIFGDYMLKWYEIHFPQEYKTVCADFQNLTQ